MLTTRTSGHNRIHRKRSGPNLLLLFGPGLALLFLWTQLPFVLTIINSLRRYNLLSPENNGFVGLQNYRSLLNDPIFWNALGTTMVLVTAVLAVTVILGMALALLFDQPFPGRTLARTLVISPFFVMPVVSALIWKNMLMNPVYGLFAWVATRLGLTPVDWLATYPLQSIIAMVAWQWTPFAMLLILTGLQSMSRDELEAARIDGATPLQELLYITLPHLAGTLSVVIMLETIFLLTIFAEIFTATSGGPGIATTTLPFFIYLKGFGEYRIGTASAGGFFAVVLANIVAVFLLRLIGRNLQPPTEASDR